MTERRTFSPAAVTGFVLAMGAAVVALMPVSAPRFLISALVSTQLMASGLAAVLAVIFSSVGIAGTRYPSPRKGRGLAIAGLIVGAVTLLLTAVAAANLESLLDPVTQ